MADSHKSDIFEEEEVDLEAPKEVSTISVEDIIAEVVNNSEEKITLEVKIEESEVEKAIQNSEKVDFSIVSKRELEAELDKVGEVVEKGRLYISDNRRDVILYRLLALIQTPKC